MADTVTPDGKRSPTFGAKLKGMVVFEANGHYALIVTRSNLPKFASNNRLQGTPEENKAIVLGSIGRALDQRAHQAAAELDEERPPWED